MSEMYFDCGGCGHIGRADQMVEHASRPMPTDIGFCPKCGYEIDDLISEDAVRKLLDEYGEDVDEAMAGIKGAE